MNKAGNLPDHVTRYTHRNESRWLIQASGTRWLDKWDIAGRIGVGLAVPVIIWAAALIVTAVM
ncbi:MAG: hypothetical protein ACI4WX_11785 [Aristaeellaceae bacterium]